MGPYSRDFFKKGREGSRRSAREIIPLILDLVQPRSVIDVGCGLGTWLSEFKEFGVGDILGVDGDYVDRRALLIPEDRFLSADLRKPLHVGRQFDLVVSLEVAEHLPPECAVEFVDSLTRLGPLVLFSAAIPFQGGAHHLNEQWPDYWASLFKARGYATTDCIRQKVWKNGKVEWWYAQNVLLFARKECLQVYPLLRTELAKTDTGSLRLVHPENYLAKADPRNASPKRLLLTLLVSIAFRLTRGRPNDSAH